MLNVVCMAKTVCEMNVIQSGSRLVFRVCMSLTRGGQVQGTVLAGFGKSKSVVQKHAGVILLHIYLRAAGLIRPSGACPRVSH